MRTLRLANALACPVLMIAAEQQWGGRWIFLPILFSGVGAVLLTLRDRESQQLDAPTVLNLHR
jgi:hypothetical protein